MKELIGEYFKVIGRMLFFLSFFFTSFSCQKFDEDIIFLISKDNFHCTPRIFQGTGNYIDFSFYTHSSWKFDEQYTDGWSKLIGLGHLNHHLNSARVGWRSQGDSIRICGYFYLEGERIIMEFEKLALNKWYSGSVYFFDDSYIITVNGKSISLSGYKRKRNFIKNPYFGGTKPAPHDIYFPFRNAWSMHSW